MTECQAEASVRVYCMISPVAVEDLRYRVLGRIFNFTFVRGPKPEQASANQGNIESYI